MLSAPLPGQAPGKVTQAQAEDEGASFMALMTAQRPG